MPALGELRDPETRRRRLRPARTAIAIAIGLLAVSAGWLALRAAVPSDGAPVLADPGYRAGLTVDALAHNGPGLHASDLVIAVNGVRLDRWLGDNGAARVRIENGTRLTYRVVRDGRERDVTVSLRRDGLEADRLRRSGGIVLTVFAVLGLGIFTVSRRPDRSAARALLVLSAGLVAYSMFTTFGYDAADVAGARIVFAIGLLGAVTTLTIWSVAAVQLAWTFPEPLPVLQRRPSLIPLVYGIALAATTGLQAALLVSGHATLARLDNLTTAAGLVLTALAFLTLAGVARTLLKARREPALRAQGALVALGLMTTVLVIVIANLVAGDQKWPAWVDALAFLPLPTTITIAIVRGEFLGIRAVVNRTLVYASLTAILLGLYAATVAVLGAVIGNSGLASTFLATGAAAVAFAPLRAGLQRRVDRMLYGERGDPARVLGALGHRLEAAVPPDQVLPAIAETLATTLNLPYVALRTGSGTQTRLACERGEPVAAPHVVPLVHQGRMVGELVVGARRGERSLSPQDALLLADVARQIATAVSAAGLLTDLTASRTRLAVAREEERAQLRHDLHDRLGPHLVGLSLQLDTLQSRTDNGDISDAISRAHSEATLALDEVRRISRGLRPAELETLGLIEAIGAVAARLTVDDDDHAWRASIDAAVQLGAIPADIEAAAYQIALEALSNAHRHSGGQGARVRLGIDAAGTVLTLEIADDGDGIDPTAPAGVGIQSMRERAASVHGSLEVAAAMSGGTVVRATLPLPEGRTAREDETR